MKTNAGKKIEPGKNPATLKYALAIVMIGHGLIHFIGTAKAYGYSAPQLTRDISGPLGILWMIPALLFIIAAILLLLNREMWYTMATPAIILSQVVIILFWKDAKWGSIINIIVLSAILQQLFNHAFVEE